jgi:hypothetical protein
MLVTVDHEATKARLSDATALWSVGAVTADEVITRACDALVAGHDSQALRELAGAPRASSVYEVEDLLAQVADDFGFSFHPKGSEQGRVAAARVLAALCISGHIAPRELARWMHDTIGHGHGEALEALVLLDDDYDLVEYAGQSAEDIDRTVIDAARKLLLMP